MNISRLVSYSILVLFPPNFLLILSNVLLSKVLRIRFLNSQHIRQNMIDNSYISPHQQRIWFENIQGRVDQMNWVVWCKGIRAGFIKIKGSGPLELQKHLGGGYYVGESQIRHGLLGYAIFLMFHDIIFEYFSVNSLI